VVVAAACGGEVLEKVTPVIAYSDNSHVLRLHSSSCTLLLDVLQAVAAEVLQQVTPIIEENKPKFIDAIEFENLTLGLLPAVIGESPLRAGVSICTVHASTQYCHVLYCPALFCFLLLTFDMIFFFC